MGNTHCQECQELRSESKAYGEFEIVHLDSKQCAFVQKKLEYRLGLSEQIGKELQKRAQIKCKNIVRLHKYEIRENCYEVDVGLYYQFMPRTLKEYLEEVEEKREELSEKQLFNLIYGVENALQTLYGMNITHGCVNLETILIKNHIFKLTDISSTTNLTSYELVMHGNRHQFLNEKLLNNLAYKVMKSYDLNIKDDLFSLGMIILMIIGKGKPQSLYLWQQKNQYLNGSLNYKYIQNCLRIMNRNYSSKLCSKIKELVFNSSNINNNNNVSHLAEQEESMGVDRVQSPQVVKVVLNGQEDQLGLELQELSQNMSRVLNKIKRGQTTNANTSKMTTLHNSNYQTPYQSLK